jgi:hypothetical protein
VRWNLAIFLHQVRITASWALANICDAIRHCVRILHFGQMGELNLMSMIE